MDKLIIFDEKPPKEVLDQSGKIILQPRVSACCRYLISKEKISQYPNCPTCGKHTEYNDDPSCRGKVKALKVQCKCGSWSGKLCDLNRHLERDCPYAMVNCSVCEQMMQRGKMEAHKTKDCSKRPFGCPHCTFTSTYDDVMNIHLPQCEEELVPCPNNCGGEAMKRKQLKEHIDQCMHTIVDCQYSFVGCTYKSNRQELVLHLETSGKEHQTMALNYIQESETIIRSLSQNNRSFKEEYCLSVQTYSTPKFTTKNIWDSQSQFSDPFYTHPGGYKMFIKISGYHPDKADLDIIIQVLNGEFDEELKVPFQGTVTLEIVDHNPHCQIEYKLQKHDIRGDQTSSLKSIAYEELVSTLQDCKYLKNNQITLRVIGIAVEHSTAEGTVAIKQDDSVSFLEQCKQKGQRREILKQQNNLLLNCFCSKSPQMCIYSKYPEFVMINFLHNFTNSKTWYSEGFYTHFGGYQLCLEVNAAGPSTGIGSGSHMSIGLHLMKGKFDYKLPFPFHGEITVQLVDQDGSNHITNTISFDEKSLKAGARSYEDRNKESCDIRKFVSLEDSKKYVKNNTLMFRVVNVVVKDLQRVNEGTSEEPMELQDDPGMSSSNLNHTDM